MQSFNGLSPLRILVVDDLHDAADTMAILLRLWGHEVAVAYNGSHALEMVSLQAPDVILLDIGLPHMDGWEVARQIRLLPDLDKALIIALTGYGQTDDLQRCLEAGIDRHFLKPVDPVELQGMLATHCRRGDGMQPRP